MKKDKKISIPLSPPHPLRESNSMPAQRSQSIQSHKEKNKNISVPLSPLSSLCCNKSIPAQSSQSIQRHKEKTIDISVPLSPLRSLCGESGHAMLEMVIGLIFLFNLTAGIIDFGSILSDYSSVVEAAHQGALLASTNNHLQSNTDQKFGNCPSSLTARSAPLPLKEQNEHQKIDERVQQILNIQDSMLDQNSLCITSTLENSSNTTDKNVVVTVQVAYDTLLYGSIPIKAQARAPFLQ